MGQTSTTASPSVEAFREILQKPLREFEEGDFSAMGLIVTDALLNRDRDLLETICIEVPVKAEQPAEPMQSQRMLSYRDVAYADLQKVKSLTADPQEELETLKRVLREVWSDISRSRGLVSQAVAVEISDLRDEGRLG